GPDLRPALNRPRVPIRSGQRSSSQSPEESTMRIRLLAIGAALFAVTVAACSSNGSAPSSTAGRSTVLPRQGEQAGHAEALTAKASTTSLGTILTDQSGRTLYAFTKDKDGTSSCADACIATWPALAGRTAPAAGEGLDKALFGTMTRTEGTVQATYNKWPLYYYVGHGQPR